MAFTNKQVTIAVSASQVVLDDFVGYYTVASSGTLTAVLSQSSSGGMSGTWTFTGSVTATPNFTDPPGFTAHTNSISEHGNVSQTGAQVFSFSGGSRFIGSGTFDTANSDLLIDATIFGNGAFGFLGAQTHLESHISSSLPPIISIDHYSGTVLEDYGIVTVTLSRSGADLNQVSQVSLSTEDGAAVSSGTFVDFAAVTNQVVTFDRGVSTVTVNLGRLINDDYTQELNENFGIRISNAVNASLGFSTGNVIILDNDKSGTSANDNLATAEGNQWILGGAGNDTIDGGAGIDTAVFTGLRSNYTITPTATGYTVTDKTGAEGTDTLVNVERLQFFDSKVAIDVHGNGGMAYRLYQAAFDRAPDTGGLGYWINAMDSGASLAQVSAAFIGSGEFQAKYGTLDNSHFTTQLYQNVLHRAPDAGGLAYWTDLLDRGAISRAGVLAGFSESPENQAALIGTIQNGMGYTL